MQHWSEAAEASNNWFARFRINTNFPVGADSSAVNIARLLNQRVEWRVEFLEHGVARQAVTGNIVEVFLDVGGEAIINDAVEMVG